MFTVQAISVIAVLLLLIVCLVFLLIHTVRAFGRLTAEQDRIIESQYESLRAKGSVSAQQKELEAALDSARQVARDIPSLVTEVWVKAWLAAAGLHRIIPAHEVQSEKLRALKAFNTTPYAEQVQVMRDRMVEL